MHALNAGLALCSADIIARHDADDPANFDRSERQPRFLRALPDCAAVSGAVRRIGVAGDGTGPVLRLPSPDLADFNERPPCEPYLMHPFLMVRRTTIEAAGATPQAAPSHRALSPREMSVSCSPSFAVDIAPVDVAPDATLCKQAGALITWDADLCHGLR